MDPYLCLNAIPNVFGIFDTSVAPTLLYYSYIPIVFLSLFFSIFLFVKNRSIQTGSLLAIAVSFSLWIVNELVQWIAVDAWLVHFGWQMSALSQLSLVFSITYFVYTFLYNKAPEFSLKFVGFIVLLPVLILLPTDFNMTSFDLIECQSLFATNLWLYIYYLQVALTAVSIFFCVKKYREPSNPEDKKKALYILIGTFILLGLFVTTNILGDATLVYEFNLVGPLGMALFIAFISYMIVRFKAFDVKLFSAQILVATLFFLVFAILFIRKIENIRIITIITLVLTAILGTVLVRSVRKEVEARELIEKQRNELEKANVRLKELDVQKSEFVSFATHQIRSPLASMRGYASLILEGDTGPVNDALRKVVETILTSTKTLSSVVEDYLNISRIELGTMKYDLREIDFKDLVTEVVNEQKPNIDAKGLTFRVSVDELEKYPIKADLDKFKQVIMNIVDNSVKYTPKGSLEVSLSKDAVKGTVTFKVSDTGVGIAPDVMPKLFRKFSRANNASEANIHGTGLGLYIAKEIVTAHGGRMWAESAGEGKGSQFYVEMREGR
ncbi:MAG: HAMP domain-containing sensor histidine kinase [Candidatus Paceibacterota bacterium]|jgi:signal transduction histidine kinase